MENLDIKKTHQMMISPMVVSVLMCVSTCVEDMSGMIPQEPRPP